MYLLAAKILAPIALLLGLWFAYEHHGTVRYEAGKKEVTDAWRESDRVAVAVGDEKTMLLKRLAASKEGTFNAKLADMAKRNAAVAADNLSVRNTLATIAATPPSRPASSPACRSYEAEYRSCAGLLGEGVELAGAGSSLVSSTSAQLTGLQEWAALVQSANK